MIKVKLTRPQQTLSLSLKTDREWIKSWKFKEKYSCKILDDFPAECVPGP